MRKFKDVYVENKTTGALSHLKNYTEESNIKYASSRLGVPKDELKIFSAQKTFEAARAASRKALDEKKKAKRDHIMKAKRDKLKSAFNNEQFEALKQILF